MSRDEALARLAARGVAGADAETALDHVLKDYGSVDEMLDRTALLSVHGVLRYFGQDGGRVILALRAAVA